MAALGEDIYEYHFATLFNRVKNLIGNSTIKVYESEEEKKSDEEFDEFVGESNLLFDITGNEFKQAKARDTEYKYWVEVQIVKIIKNLFSRYGKKYDEKNHPGFNEQHSIVYEFEGKRIEAYFLFDMEYEEATRTDYDKIANVLAENSQNIDKIIIYIFRDRINIFNLASLINGCDERNANGLVEVCPLHCFFEEQFGDEEYAAFLEHANLFHSRCDRIISYKTVITPTKRTLSAFKKSKCEMLRDQDYLDIVNKKQIGELSEREFKKVKDSFLNNKMYTAMVSSNDYADSFISAEWSYDIYKNLMGELELTGIIAGYLKSVEQLMYKIARFHRDQGIIIRTSNGYQPYTKDNEEYIDSTLKALNDFITSPKGRLALSKDIRVCIRDVVDLWREYYRNKLFHKENLYKPNNTIENVRETTLYLYFLILGGISFTTDEMQQLGVNNTSEKNQSVFNEEREYLVFKKWLDNVMKYDLPDKSPGLWILLTNDKDIWEASPYLMKWFYIDEFESGSCNFDSEQMLLSHTNDIPSFIWKDETDNTITASHHFQQLFYRYEDEHEKEMNRIQAIILGFYKANQLIHFNNNFL